MNRIIHLKNVSLDLGNIKSVELDADALSYSSGYLIISLLYGKEYVYNEKTNDYELIEPVIKIYSPEYGELARMEDRLLESWNKYLKEKENSI